MRHNKNEVTETVVVVQDNDKDAWNYQIALNYVLKEIREKHNLIGMPIVFPTTLPDGRLTSIIQFTYDTTPELDDIMLQALVRDMLQDLKFCADDGIDSEANRRIAYDKIAVFYHL